MEGQPDQLSTIDETEQIEQVDSEEIDCANNEDVILKDCEVDEGSESESESGSGDSVGEGADGDDDAEVERDTQEVKEEEEGAEEDEGEEDEEDEEEEENDFVEGAGDLNPDEGADNVGEEQEEKPEADDKEEVAGEAEAAEAEAAEEKEAEEEKKEEDEGEEEKKEESVKPAEEVDSAAPDVAPPTTADVRANNVSAKEGGEEQQKKEPAEPKTAEPGKVNYAYMKTKGDTILMNVCNPKNINLTDIQSNKETNKHILFPSLSPTDMPIPGREKENITMLHMDPEKCGYKYSSGVNPAEGYLFVYPHVSNNSIPPKIRKKRSVCC